MLVIAVEIMREKHSEAVANFMREFNELAPETASYKAFIYFMLNKLPTWGVNKAIDWLKEYKRG